MKKEPCENCGASDYWNAVFFEGKFFCGDSCRNSWRKNQQERLNRAIEAARKRREMDVSN